MDISMDAVLGLADFGRFVFVMSVLGHYSHHECALLLGCSALGIREGRVHALEALAGSGRTVSFLLQLSKLVLAAIMAAGRRQQAERLSEPMVGLTHARHKRIRPG